MNPGEDGARQAIQATLAWYNACGDRSEYDKAALAFHADGVIAFASGRVLQGRAEIAPFLAKMFRDRTEPYTGTIFQRHHLSTCAIEFTGPGEADTTTYFSVLTELGLDHFGVYSDRFVKAGDQWLIARRRIRIDHVRPDSRFARAGMKAASD